MRKTIIALLAGATAMGFLTPATATAVEGYSSDVQEAAVAAITATEGISEAAAKQVLRIQDSSTQTIDNAVAALGGREAGGYLDATGRPVVNVLDAAAAAQVRQAGAGAQLVKYSTAQLDLAQGALEAVSVAHTAIGTDPKTNQVVLTIADAAKGTDALLTAAASLGDKVRVEHVTGAMTKTIYNGEAITGGGYRCSAGFNTNRSGQNYTVTAGHCTDAVSSWSIGPTTNSSFPTNDYGLIRNTTGSAPGYVQLWNGSTQRISSAANPSVGTSICKSGSTTHLTCGSVTRTNVTVNYSEGSVYQMIETNASVNSGDSGGCLYSGSVGRGITSGMGGGLSYYQPVVEALNAYSLSLN